MENDKTASGVTRLAGAAASAAAGAAAGGPYGAAVGAAKAFLPEITKTVISIAAMLIILPLLAITAIPNIFFGYESANDADVAAFTDKARLIEYAYDMVENFNAEHVNSIVAEAIASYTDPDSGALFDETETISDISGTNLYWLIAITSVYHKQDLFAMDTASIKEMAWEKLFYSSEITTRTEGEGDEAVTVFTLWIRIEDLTPDALMDRLGFADEQRAWASLLYSTLIEDQSLRLSDSDGPGYYGTDYGDITFSDTEIAVVYYNQTDARWGNLAYGKTGTIGASGCGPTALAIAVASLSESNRSVTPEETARWSVENGYRCEGSGSYHSLIPGGGAHYGLRVEGLGRDAGKVAGALTDGKLVIAIMSKGHFTSGGHFIVLRGLTEDGNIMVADPASVKRSEKEWPLRLICNEANRNAGSGGPFWALSPEP